MIKIILTCDICKKNDEKDDKKIYEVSSSVTALFDLIHSNYNVNHMCTDCWRNKFPKLDSNSTITEPKKIILLLPTNATDKLEEIIR